MQTKATAMEHPEPEEPHINGDLEEDVTDVPAGYEPLPQSIDSDDSSDEDDVDDSLLTVDQYQQLNPSDQQLEQTAVLDVDFAALEALDSPAFQPSINAGLVASIRAQGLIETQPVEPVEVTADDFELPEDNIGQIQEAMQNISLTLQPPDWLLE
eukprot:m.174811 g.174811  ORF g.174811 m.174811 type:complete len:155 (-) comp16758_c0_seq1:2549-3013(-)